LSGKFTVTTASAATTLSTSTTATSSNHEEVSTKLNNWGFYECHYF
jgi:hypothetical protein